MNPIFQACPLHYLQLVDPDAPTRTLRSFLLIRAEHRNAVNQLVIVDSVCTGKSALKVIPLCVMKAVTLATVDFRPPIAGNKLAGIDSCDDSDRVNFRVYYVFHVSLLKVPQKYQYSFQNRGTA